MCLGKEMWIGLENLHLLTHAKNYSLLVELTSSSNTTAYALYDSFKVGPKVCCEQI